MRIFWFFYNLRWSKRVVMRVPRHLCGSQDTHEAHLVHRTREYVPCSTFWCDGKK